MRESTTVGSWLKLVRFGSDVRSFGVWFRPWFRSPPFGLFGELPLLGELQMVAYLDSFTVPKQLELALLALLCCNELLVRCGGLKPSLRRGEVSELP